MITWGACGPISRQLLCLDTWSVPLAFTLSQFICHFGKCFIYGTRGTLNTAAVVGFVYFVLTVVRQNCSSVVSVLLGPAARSIVKVQFVDIAKRSVDKRTLLHPITGCGVTKTYLKKILTFQAIFTFNIANFCC